MTIDATDAVAVLERAVAQHRLTRKSMFGCATAFAGERMCMLVYGGRLVLRLPEPARGRAVTAGAEPWVARGRRMWEYVVYPEGVTWSALRGEIGHAVRYARGSGDAADDTAGAG